MFYLLSVVDVVFLFTYVFARFIVLVLFCVFVFYIFSKNYFFFLPYSFGKRNGGSVRRPSECFVLESSEMIVVSVSLKLFDTNIYLLNWRK